MLSGSLLSYLKKRKISWNGQSLSLVVIRCTTHCHSLSLIVIRCHSLYHSLSLVVLLVVIRCHSLSLIVTRCTTRLSFYKWSKKSTFTCIKSCNRYNLRHNNCVIFSIFAYFKYRFLSNSFIYKFVHAIIFLFIERKAISCLSVELLNMY